MADAIAPQLRIGLQRRSVIVHERFERPLHNLVCNIWHGSTNDPLFDLFAHPENHAVRLCVGRVGNACPRGFAHWDRDGLAQPPKLALESTRGSRSSLMIVE